MRVKKLAFLDLHYKLILVVLFLLLSARSVATTSDEFPRKPIKIIVPFDAGGGSDTFTRILQQAIQENSLISQPLVVINVPGAGGTIGSRRVKHARPDGYTLLQLHEGMLTSKYSGNAEYGPEAFECIAGTGSTAHVIAVPQASPHANIHELLQAATEEPDSVLYAVGIGAPSHFAGLMLENAKRGAMFRFTQTGGGAKRFASLLGGHSDVTTFSIAEYVDFQSSGLRALAILTDTRHRQAPDVPTAKEQGLDVVSTNMYFWWAPKGTSSERLGIVAEMLRRAMATDQVKRKLGEMLTDPVVLTGERLRDDLKRRETLIAAVSQRPTAKLPNFPLFVLGACVLFGVASCWNTGIRNSLPHTRTCPTRKHATQWISPLVRRASMRSPMPYRCRSVREGGEASAANAGKPELRTRADYLALSVTIAATLSYVASMQLGWLSFRVSTMLFVLAVGCTLSRKQPRMMLVVALAAVLLGFGLHAIFTRVFVIDLPS